MPQNSQAPQNEGLLYLIPAIKSRINCLELIQQSLVPVERLNVRGNRATGLCPLHTEKTPSFVVYLDKDRWYCFGCHEHGDVIDLFAKYHGVSNKEAIQQLASILGISRDPSPRQRVELEKARQRQEAEKILNKLIESRIDSYFNQLAAIERNGEQRFLHLASDGLNPLDDWLCCWWLQQREKVTEWLDRLMSDDPTDQIITLQEVGAWL